MKYLFLVLTIAFSSTCFSAPVKRWHDGFSHDFSSDAVTSGAQYTYWSGDVREHVYSDFSFTCDATKDNMVGSLTWSGVEEQFPFIGEPIEAHFFVNAKPIMILHGENTGSYEGTIDITRAQLDELVAAMGKGKMMDVIILNRPKNIESHIVLSLDGFETKHSIFVCFD